MKAEARYLDRSYELLLREVDDGFEVRIGDQSFIVRLLDRTNARWTLEIEGRIHDVLITEGEQGLLVQWQNHTFPIEIYSRKHRLEHGAPGFEMTGRIAVKSQMPGKVVCVLVGEGTEVEQGQGLVIIEAMKMQNELKAPKKGKVLTCRTQAGKTVNAGELLFEIE
ncbi:MAG: biotin/lipoyl-binding protein [Acidobacteria bacterium]|nr:biotin/lipoyl-binding protein [Acidobacteriota bacterium]